MSRQTPRPLCLALAILAIGAAAGCSKTAPSGAQAADSVPADPAPATSADAAQAMAALTLPTRPDDRTLNAAHPYRDKHGLQACAEDCTVHEAGYKWAAMHGLNDKTRCSGRTLAFVDGCKAYVQDHSQG
jgi:nucleoid-associated protein YgaU